MPNTARRLTAGRITLPAAYLTAWEIRDGDHIHAMRYGDSVILWPGEGHARSTALRVWQGGRVMLPTVWRESLPRVLCAEWIDGDDQLVLSE